MSRLRILAVVVTIGLISAAARSESFYDRHVYFDNSPADRSCYLSDGMVVAPSKLEMVDGKFPVDSSGILPSGKSFSTPLQMRDILTAMTPDFARCLTEKMMTYALGRGLKPYDKRTIEDIDAKLAASGYGFQTLVTEIVHSLPFESRRGEDVSTQSVAQK